MLKLVYDEKKISTSTNLNLYLNEVSFLKNNFIDFNLLQNIRNIEIFNKQKIRKIDHSVKDSNIILMSSLEMAKMLKIDSRRIQAEEDIQTSLNVIIARSKQLRKSHSFQVRILI